MEFDWTTFALEVINFVVLVWILQRFLYKPVIAAIAARKAGIEKTLADANALQTMAQSLKQQYENRMADWNREKAEARMQMLREMDAERTRMLAALNVALGQEREKSRGLEQRKALEFRRRLEEKALAEGAQFVSRLLSRLASPPLEEKMCEILLEDLPHLADKDQQSLRRACQSESGKIRINSAYQLGEVQRSDLAQALKGLAGQPVECDFGRDPDLLAGLCVSIGPWMLRANLRDELKFFAEVYGRG